MGVAVTLPFLIEHEPSTQPPLKLPSATVVTDGFNAWHLECRPN